MSITEEELARGYANVDLLRYRVFSQKTLPQDDVRISVSVSALISTREADSSVIYEQIRSALHDFIATEWTLSRIERQGDAVGYERVQLHADARVAPKENYNLGERARAASREGLALTDPEVDYSLPASRVSQAVQLLREEALREVQEHIARFTEVTGRKWRLGDIEFGVEGPGTMANVRSLKGAYRSEIPALLGRDDDGSPYTGAERVILVTYVVLKSTAACTCSQAA
jgi:hypothetical protein